MIEKILLHRPLSRLIALLCAAILLASCGKAGKGDAPISDGITSTPVSAADSEAGEFVSYACYLVPLGS